MNRTERLFALREELRRAGRSGRTAEQLARRLEVSTRTVKRDVSALQHGGFPLAARPGPGGGYVVDPRATLPPINFTEAEVAGLACAVAAHRGQPFERQARSVLAKAMGVMDPRARERAVGLTDRVWTDAGPRAVQPRIMRTVEESLEAMRVLVLEMEHADGRTSEHVLDPVLVAHTRGHWYLVGRCRPSTEVRWFRLDRAVSARPTRERAVEVPVAAVGNPPATASAVTDA